MNQAEAANGAYSVPILVLSAVIVGGILELIGLAIAQMIIGTLDIDFPFGWWAIASALVGLLYGHAAAKPLSAEDLEVNRKIKEEKAREYWKMPKAESRLPKVTYSCPYCIMEVHRDATICPYCRSRLV